MGRYNNQVFSNTLLIETSLTQKQISLYEKRMETH